MAVTGRAVALVALGIVAVLIDPSPATVRWWLLICALLVGLDALLAPRTAGLRVTRAPLAPVRRHEPTQTTLTVTNTGNRRVRGLLRDAWVPSAGPDGRSAPPAPLRLAPGASATVTTGLRPTRRGDRPADRVTVRTFGPLGLAARQRSRPVGGALRVLPEFASRRHLPELMRRLRDIDGRTAVRVRGQGSEFDSLRDYVTGDDVRSIDWRATARRRATVVRTWRPERDRRLVVVLDTSRTSAVRVGDEPLLDAGIEATLLLAALAAHAGDHVDVVAGDRAVRARVTGARRGDVLAATSDAVAPLEPALTEADWPALLSAALAPVRGGRALIVLLTSLDPVAVAEGLLPALPPLLRRHHVLLGAVRDPALEALALTGAEEAVGSAGADREGDAWLAAAAQHDLTEREHTADALRRLGVDVVQASPDALPRALADRYLTLKDRGRL